MEYMFKWLKHILFGISGIDENIIDPPPKPKKHELSNYTLSRPAYNKKSVFPSSISNTKNISSNTSNISNRIDKLNELYRSIDDDYIFNSIIDTNRLINPLVAYDYTNHTSKDNSDDLISSSSHHHSGSSSSDYSSSDYSSSDYGDNDGDW
jgi:hypothetical protein